MLDVAAVSADPEQTSPVADSSSSPAATSTTEDISPNVASLAHVAATSTSEEELPVTSTVQETSKADSPQSPASEFAGASPALATDSQMGSPNFLPAEVPLSASDSSALSSLQAPDEPINADASLSAYKATPDPVESRAPKKRQSKLKIALIALFIVLLLGGSGIAAFVYSTIRPQPAMHLTSLYVLGSIPIGATDTTFQVSTQNFPGHAKITFLLDGAVAPGNITRQSDSTGTFTGTLVVTGAWKIGKHTITARDASGSATPKGITILIVAAGQDKTPGPHGAPTDSASGTIAITIAAQPGISVVDPGALQQGAFFKKDGGSGQQEIRVLSPGKLDLVVTAGTNGGTVCGKDDDGKVHSQTMPDPSSGLSLAQPAPGPTSTTETVTFSATCSGTYRSGHLTYIQTYTSYTTRTSFPDTNLGRIHISNLGILCTLENPYVAKRLEGTFTSPTAVSGTYASEAHTIHCVGLGGLGFYSPTTGQTSQTRDDNSPAISSTWNGIAAMRDPTAPVVPRAKATATSSTGFLGPSGPSVPNVYEDSATPTTGPLTTPKMKGTPVILADGLRYVNIKIGSGSAMKSGSMVRANAQNVSIC